MAQQLITIGTNPNDGTGDPIRTAFQKVNANFTEVYASAQISITSYGAKLNGKQVFDGVVSGTGLTSASAAFTSADVGKVIAIVGAGTSGANFATTISAVNSGTSITLASAAATAIGSNASFVYGTDDSVAWQTALTALSVTGGRISAPPGISIIGRALQTFGNSGNSQINIPTLSPTNSATGTTIQIVGASASQPPSYWAAKPSTAGTTLFSTITGSGTRPSMIGGDPSLAGGYLNPLRLVVENINLRSMPDAGLCLLDAGTVETFSSRSVKYDTFTTINGITSAPANTNSIGFYCSGRGSTCVWSHHDVYVQGFYTGFVAGEAGYINNMFVYACTQAGVMPVMDYPTSFGLFIVSWCPRGLVWTGRHDAYIANYLTESWANIGNGASWMTTVYNFDDSGNNWSGRVSSYYEVLAGVGRRGKLLTNAAVNAVITPASLGPKVKNTTTFADISSSDTSGPSGTPANWTAGTGNELTMDCGGDVRLTAVLSFSVFTITSPQVYARIWDVTNSQEITRWVAYYSENSTAETKILHSTKTAFVRVPSGGNQYRIEIAAAYNAASSPAVRLNYQSVLGGSSLSASGA